MREHQIVEQNAIEFFIRKSRPLLLRHEDVAREEYQAGPSLAEVSRHLRERQRRVGKWSNPAAQEVNRLRGIACHLQGKVRRSRCRRYPWGNAETMLRLTSIPYRQIRWRDHFAAYGKAPFNITRRIALNPCGSSLRVLLNVMAKIEACHRDWTLGFPV